ncbi:Uncharacterized protein OS=Sorangium cellulosum (strain So ce56) GN=sce5710 PE=4 SV=1 [Gemmata massiliana]|uniref:SMI1/KNR4 family protein n=1 Tax=Gemmata massiliana TaxID=1210884 RepID=A0A6P2D3U4_9BACT|nr:hypothetical protein [Gemmata massiliana]VTR94122.1 Uncharacterized protein OS=Sorangium cellulosum (strain So ce56) GN=sce5710 PE=4 SV=1 [Gemmata massiliana]
MDEAQWLSADDNPIAMLCTLKGRATGRKVLLYTCACQRMWWPLIEDMISLQDIDTVEERADSEATRKELDETGVPLDWGTERALRDMGEYIGEWARLARKEAARRAVVAAPDREFNSRAVQIQANAAQAALLRDIFGNPFRPVTFSPSWRTSTAVALASQMYESRDFGAMPILADALQDAGCDSTDVLDHCRGPGPHVRGCWVVDLVLGNE